MEWSHSQKVSFKVGKELIQGLVFCAKLRDLGFISEANENYWKNLSKVVTCLEFDAVRSLWTPVEYGWDK